jgi:hypothetical protein
MTWVFYSLNFVVDRTVQFDESTEDPVFFEYELPIPPCMMVPRSQDDDPQYGSPARKWLIPVCNRLGYFDGLPVPDPSYSLIFYRQWRQDNNGDSYPLGTNDFIDYAGNVIADHPLSFRIDDAPNSLWNNHLKSFIEWRAKSEGTYTVRKLVTSSELAHIDMLKWYNINGMDYLIKEIRFELSDKDVIMAEFDVVPRMVRNGV